MCIKLSILLIIPILVTYILHISQGLLYCHSCRSRGELGTCKDPLYSNKGLVSNVTILCASGWCTKMIETEDAFKEDSIPTSQTVNWADFRTHLQANSSYMPYLAGEDLTITMRSLCALSSAFSELSNSAPFFVLAYHREESQQRCHWHIVHSCSWSNRSCRCKLFDGECFRGGYRRLPHHLLSETYLRNIVQYLSSWPRELHYLYLPHLRRTICHPPKGFSVCGCIECSAREVMDEHASGSSLRHSHGPSGYTCHFNDHTTAGSSRSLHFASANVHVGKVEEIYQLVKRLCVTPINNIIHYIYTDFFFLCICFLCLGITRWK